MTKPPVRPRDMNQRAKSIVDLATMDEEELAKFRAEQQRKAKPGSQKGKGG